MRALLVFCFSTSIEGTVVCLGSNCTSSSLSLNFSRENSERKGENWLSKQGAWKM